MTFGEIYTRVMWLVYGDTNYPQSTQTHMSNINYGIISEAHRKVQNDFNYWFMERVYMKELEAGKVAFDLPSAFKQDVYIRIIEYNDVSETTGGDATVLSNGNVATVAFECDAWEYIIKVGDRWYWIVNGSDTQIEVLPAEESTGSYDIRKVTGIYTIQKDKWFKAIDLAYFVKDGKLYLTRALSRDAVIELVYYTTYTPYEPFNSYEDAITTNAADAIIYMAVELEERRRREFQAATYYRNLADAELLRLKKEHNAKSLAHLRVKLQE
mgnify:FL=1